MSKVNAHVQRAISLLSQQINERHKRKFGAEDDVVDLISDDEAYPEPPPKVPRSGPKSAPKSAAKSSAGAASSTSSSTSSATRSATSSATSSAARSASTSSSVGFPSMRWMAYDNKENFTEDIDLIFEDWPAGAQDRKNAPTPLKMRNFIKKYINTEGYANVNYAIEQDDMYCVIETDPVPPNQSVKESHEITKIAQLFMTDFLYANSAIIDLKFEDLQQATLDGLKYILISMRPLFRYSQRQGPRASFPHPVLAIAHSGCINYNKPAHPIHTPFTYTWDIAMTAVSYHISILFFVIRGFPIREMNFSSVDYGSHPDYSEQGGNLPSHKKREEIDHELLGNLCGWIIRNMPTNQADFEIVRPYAMTIFYAYIGQTTLVIFDHKDKNLNHLLAQQWKYYNHQQIVPLFFWTALSRSNWHKFFLDDEVETPSQQSEKLHSLRDDSDLDLFEVKPAVELVVLMKDLDEVIEIMDRPLEGIFLANIDKQLRLKAIACTYDDGKQAVLCVGELYGQERFFVITSLFKHDDIADYVVVTARIHGYFGRRANVTSHEFPIKPGSFQCLVCGETEVRPKCSCQRMLQDGHVIAGFVHLYHACMAVNGFVLSPL